VRREGTWGKGKLRRGIREMGVELGLGQGMGALLVICYVRNE
jgi:hypothetical protein